jgi:BirA family transcriptional regulator, biotin operon repressor / biotin---[acetyl-CoA-carboxylase] ligase
MFEPLPEDIAVAVDAARARLGAYQDLLFVEAVDSTNDVALALAGTGRPEGTAVLADWQRAGRGRRGREWFSPPGAGLYLSVVVRPITLHGALPIVTLAAGVAAAEAVQAASGLPVELKWPNDLVIGRPWRKMGGILAETVTSGAGIDAVVIGIGINLLQTSYPPTIADRATSIETELGRPIARASVVVELLGALADMMARVHAGERDHICRAWRRFGRTGLCRQAVRWTDVRGQRHGHVCDIDADGALLVEVDGLVERLIAGEVIWEALSREG